MKLVEGIKLQGKRTEIPDCSRDDLPTFFLEMGYKVGAEIGVYKGEFTEKFAQTNLNIYGVDPWIVYEDYKLPDKKQVERQFRQDELFRQANERLEKYPNCTLVRKTSMDALADFEDESLDFVYIDANHGFRYVADDLWEWTKKVKKGGVMSGHDYAVTIDANDKYAYHVKYAVDGFTEAKQIKNWYVLGRKETRPEEKRDKWRSWMWIKT